MWEDGWSPREKKLAAAVGVLVLLLGGIVAASWWGGEPEEEAGWPEYEAKPAQVAVEKAEPKEKKEPADVVVDVKGAVKNPGVYRLAPGSRVQDAVERAGGPASGADMVRVNLAQPLTDGMALVIPKEGEESPSGMPAGPAPAGQASAAQPGGTGAGPINLNTATAQELDALNGIGPAKAEAIVRHREENGPFSSVDELTEVSGIGEKTLEQFRDQVTVQ